MKFCKDCKFMGSEPTPLCKAVLHLVTGEPRGMQCEMARIMKSDQGGCGIEATLFKDRVADGQA